MPVMQRTPMAWAVLGGGAWGTALADALAYAGNTVVVWDRDPLVVEDLNKNHRNRKRYSEAAVHEAVRGTTDKEAAVKEAQAILVALPSDVNDSFAATLGPLLRPEQAVVIASKGFRERDGALLTQVWREAAPQLALYVLTGPTFAAELMAHQHTSALLAGPEGPQRAELAESLNAPWLRIYEGNDVVGAQVGGALKNVLAISAGLLDGLSLGYNARAALLTRGLTEMGKLAKALGGSEQTIYGLAGMGDLLLTATSMLSRNYRFGVMVGKGVPLAEAKLKLGTVEGVLAGRIASVQAQSLGVELAIIAAMDGILHGDVAPLQALEYLMLRPRENEF